ncbi:helix-turn-helix transcriptional regulator [Streptomyces sp. NPDC086091]|uniref:helix-turn-helix transcriptional regulator n=1 Tax=Streptomyces sp. NPDC086091 TaxID=3365751 RepID=UPI00380A0F07
MDAHEAECRSLLPPVLLLLLAERPGHGYELVRRLAAMGWTDIDSAHVYRLLRGLEACGSVTSSWDASFHGPARRVYTVTHQGAMELALSFVRLGELHGVLHLFLERYGQLRDATAPDGTGPEPTGPGPDATGPDATGPGATRPGAGAHPGPGKGPRAPSVRSGRTDRAERPHHMRRNRT